MEAIDIYCRLFANLHVKVEKNIKFPHKAILLLGIMDLIRCGYISDNIIYLDDTIRYAFESTWKVYVDNNIPNTWTPFWHLKNEPFWHFSPVYSMETIETLVPPGGTASIGQMRAVIQYVYLDPSLFALMLNKKYREKLQTVLVSNYIS